MLPPATLRHNYQPGGMQDCKQIEAADAIEWASALGLAKRSSYLSGMIRAHAALVRSAEAPLLDMVEEFIDFAHAGAFVFPLRGTRRTGSSVSKGRPEAGCEVRLNAR